MGNTQNKYSKMIKISLFILLLAAYCSAAPSQVGIPPHGTPLTIDGATCPDVTGSTNFDAVAYMGRWYQIAAAPFFWSNPKDTCTWANYTLLDDGSVKVVNSEIQWWSGQRFTSTGSAVVNPNQPGTLSVAFGPITPDPEGENYIILNTDNEHFTYVWSCSNNRDGGHRPILWILNRTAVQTEEATTSEISFAFDILKGFGYSESSLEQLGHAMTITKQTNCDYN